MPDSKDSDSKRNGSPEDVPARSCVQLLLQRFPHVYAVSAQLLERHETFRELCEEYEACTEALERLSHGEPDAAIVREYSALRLRLEGELLRYISEHWGNDGTR
jgi:hypothetical protein